MPQTSSEACRQLQKTLQELLETAIHVNQYRQSNGGSMRSTRRPVRPTQTAYVQRVYSRKRANCGADVCETSLDFQPSMDDPVWDFHNRLCSGCYWNAPPPVLLLYCLYANFERYSSISIKCSSEKDYTRLARAKRYPRPPMYYPAWVRH